MVRFKLLLLIGLCPSFSWAQVRMPVGKFVTDSIEIGRPFKYALSFEHAPHLDLYFPDSTFDFSPYELVDIQAASTQTKNGISKDSATYTFKSFSIDSLQYLSLPVKIVNQADTVVLFAKPDSVVYNPSQQSGNVWQMENRFKFLSPQADIIKLSLSILAFLSIFILIRIAFRKQINRVFTIFQVRAKHREFVSFFDKLTKNNRDHKKIATAVTAWKSHLQFLSEKPFLTFTSKEIAENLESQSLEMALKEIDSALYGGQWPENFGFTFTILKNQARLLFQKKLEEIRNQ